MKNLIDPGHGRNTPGKCSPDGRFREYQYTREIAAAVVARLQALGHDAEVLVPEFEDIPLSERVRRVNAWCRRLGKDHVVLVSVHVDAAGSDGQRHTATGWSATPPPSRPPATVSPTVSTALPRSICRATRFGRIIPMEIRTKKPVSTY